MKVKGRKIFRAALHDDGAAPHCRDCRRSILIGAAMVLAALAANAANASSMSYQFTSVSEGSGSGDNLSLEISAYTNAVGLAQGMQPTVSFIFRNSDAKNSAMQAIAFSSSRFFASTEISAPGGSGAWQESASVFQRELFTDVPGLPGGDPLIFSRLHERPAASDHVEFRFTLMEGKTVDSLLAAIELGFGDPANANALYIGLQTVDLNTGLPSGYVVNVIPLPAPAVMVGLGLLMIPILRQMRLVKHRRGASLDK